MSAAETPKKKRGFWYYFVLLLWDTFLVFILAPPLLQIFNPLPTAGFTNREIENFDQLYRDANYVVVLSVDIAEDDNDYFLSGVVIEHEDKHYILTAAHLTDANQTISKITVYHFTEKQTNIYTANLLGYHRRLDVAVLQFTTTYRGNSIAWGDSMALANGDKVMALGLDLEDSSSGPLRVGRALGVSISARWWLMGTDMFSLKNSDRIYFGAGIHGGYSGGPIVDNQGRLVGIVSGKSHPRPTGIDITEDDISISLHRDYDYGVASHAIREILPQLINGLRSE